MLHVTPATRPCSASTNNSKRTLFKVVQAVSECFICFPSPSLSFCFLGRCGPINRGTRRCRPSLNMSKDSSSLWTAHDHACFRSSFMSCSSFVLSSPIGEVAKRGALICSCNSCSSLVGPQAKWVQQEPFCSSSGLATARVKSAHDGDNWDWELGKISSCKAGQTTEWASLLQALGSEFPR